MPPSNWGALIALTGLRSGLYCVILPSTEPTANCLPLGLQHMQVEPEAGGISFISMLGPLNSYSPTKTNNKIQVFFVCKKSQTLPSDLSLLQTVKMPGMVGFQQTSTTNTPGVADNLISFITATSYSQKIINEQSSH